MFAAAVKVVSQFTRPVVVSIAKTDGTLTSSMGAFVVVNRDGWILTAKHMVDLDAKLSARKSSYHSYQAEVAAIQADKGLLSTQKRKKIAKLGRATDDSIIDYGYWWGHDGWTLAEAHLVPDADLALCRLDGFDGALVSAYPTFKDPAQGIDPGTSICRLGFPFQGVKQQFDNGVFQIDPSTLVFFPNEGIFTRIVVVSNAASMIETSSPGLRGQSGGPLFDRHGTVWGIQSLTGHLALGFSPPVPGGKSGEVEHQFLNVGRGADPATIVRLLEEKAVTFDRSAY